MKYDLVAAVALFVLVGPAVGAERIDFSLERERFPFVDEWLGEFCDELGEAMVGGGEPQYSYLKPDDPKAGSKNDKTWAFYSLAKKFHEANAAFLRDGERLADAGKLGGFGRWHVLRMNGLEPLPAHPCVHHGVWRAKDGRTRLFLVNPSWAQSDWTWEGRGRELSGKLAPRHFAAIDLSDGPDVADVRALVAKESASGGRTGWLTARPNEQYPSVTWSFDRSDWSAYDRLVIDVVSHDVGGDRLMLYVKDSWTKGKQADWILDSATPGPYGVTRWIVDLARPRETTCVLSSVGELHIFAGSPKHAAYEFAAVRLVRHGAPLPPLPEPPAEVAAKRAKHEADDFAEKVAAMDGMTPLGDLRIGKATSMEKIRPDVKLAVPRPLGPGVQLKLARNEHEAVQILVGNAGRKTAKGVSVSVSGLKLDASVGVTGYVRTRNVPRYRSGYNVPTNSAAGYVRLTKETPVGWWPDPILDFLDGADVKPGTVQSFWIDLRCPKDLPAGVYSGTITVTSQPSQPSQPSTLDIPFKVRVWDFGLPDASPMPLAITFHPEGPCKGLVNGRLDEWADFLADHYITIDCLYFYEHPRWDQLVRLKRQGRLGRFNLSMWQNFKRSAEAEVKFRDPKNDANGWGEVRMDAEYAKAKELGLLDHAYIYGMDEIPTNAFPSMKASLPYYKERYPGVPIMTTCYDYTYGEDGMLKDVDVFIPDTTKYDLANAEKARANGRHVWWYLACVPHAPYANFFVEYEAIEVRSLMGAQAVRFRPEGFLYYQTSIWRDNRPVTTGPYTDWNPLSWGGEGNEYNGDGCWTVVGPEGRPLETIRLYSFRDGLEDYAYAKILKEKTGAWPEVPVTIVESVTNFNVSAAAHYRWRDRLAEAIEKSGGR